MEELTDIEICEDAYPIDDWRIVQSKYDPQTCPSDETIFATANGYLGIRGNFEEGSPVFQRGTFLNGFYESWPINYPEEAYGFAKMGQTMLNVTDAHIIRLSVDGETFLLDTANIQKFERALDMREGKMSREVIWKTAGGKKVRVKSERLVSFEDRHLAAISYEVTVLDASAELLIASEMVCEQEEDDSAGDPRKSRAFDHHVFEPRMQKVQDQRVTLCHQTHNSKLLIACGMDHLIDTENQYEEETVHTEDTAQVNYSVKAAPEKPVTIIKYISYYHASDVKPEALCKDIDNTLDQAECKGFLNLLVNQRKFLDEFWCRSDVTVEGVRPRAQQCARLNLFHVLEASGRAEGFGIGARGLTGSAYEGHYFWDTEIYLLPFLTYTQPHLARNLLLFRYQLLDKARERAREVNQKGALFPWRTITGDEASAFFPAGTAQYHINADIIYALKKYVDITGDQQFLYEYGAEMLVETSRLWADLGFFGADGKFHIHGVTGPDEYTAIVDDNTYTNLMARENLKYGVAAMTQLKERSPKDYKSLLEKTGLQESEVEDWQNAADKMYIPFDEKIGIIPQDKNFLDRDVWDFEGTPREKYPLLLHFHPLVLYRHQVIKQADIVLALFLLGHEFSYDEKKKNFDYYEPLTTGDSSLSACIQGIVGLELGYTDLATQYIRQTALMDFADVAGNARDGAHIAAMGGTWMGIVYGIAGMRDYDGNISFSPKPVYQDIRLGITLTIRGQRLHIKISAHESVYTLVEGDGLSILHDGQSIQLLPNQPISMPLTMNGKETGEI